MPADSVNMVIPAQHKSLLDYLFIIRDNYKIIDFLETGIDDRMQSMATLTSNRLFVVPNFSENYIDPQTDQKDWPDLLNLDTILEDEKYRRLFILGDPGTGKTTLLNRISYTLSEKASASSLGKDKSVLIPFPLTLRELLKDTHQNKLETWEDLLKVFFAQKYFKNLKPDYTLIESIFQNGQAFVLLDGLDEVSDPELREKLANVILQGIEKYPNSYWWCTSRIVGFNQLEFWFPEIKSIIGVANAFSEVILTIVKKSKKNTALKLKDLEKEFLDTSQQSNFSIKSSNESLEWINEKDETALENISNLNWQELYLAPFDDSQVARFIRLWFDYFEPRPVEREEGIKNFLSSLDAHDSIKHLARIPNLLTMMALYHRMNRHFPDGRYELFRSITEAYLETVYKKRNIQVQHQLTFNEQVRCMAALAYEMQKMRDEDADGVHLTISRAEAEAIFLERLQQINRFDDKEELKLKVHDFFESLKKRSEILIPKTDNDYGFLHLSLQEFFAAEYLREQFEKNTGRGSTEEEEQAYWKMMREYADSDVWHEPILLYFESFQNKWQDRPDDCRYAFDKIFARSAKKEIMLYRGFDFLVAKVLTDEFISKNFIPEVRFNILDDIMLPNLEYTVGSASKYIRAWGIKTHRYLYWTKTTNIQHTSYRWVIVVEAIDNYEDISQLEHTVGLIIKPKEFDDVTPLSNLQNLVKLNLSNTQVHNVDALDNLQNLKLLNLYGTQVRNVDALGNLHNLEWLNLSGTQVRNVDALGNLQNIKDLYLNDTAVQDIDTLGNLQNLEWLNLNDTQVNNIDALSNLQNLAGLYLMRTQVHNVDALGNLQNLVGLFLNGTQVSNIDALGKLQNLGWLNLNGTQVSNIDALGKLQNLEVLYLNGTQINNINALGNLPNIRVLGLDGIQVYNLQPLYKLQSLREISLIDTPVSAQAIEELKAALPNAKIITEPPQEKK